MSLHRTLRGLATCVQLTSVTPSTARESTTASTTSATLRESRWLQWTTLHTWHMTSTSTEHNSLTPASTSALRTSRVMAFNRPAVLNSWLLVSIAAASYSSLSFTITLELSRLYTCTTVSISIIIERCILDRIALSTSWRYLEQSCARFLAELRPRLYCWRSSSVVRSQVCLGRPRGRCQSGGRRLMAALRARVWSCDRPARAVWP